MNGRPEPIINLHDIEVVTETLKRELSEQWMLIPEGKLPAIAMKIVHDLDEDRAKRK